MIYEGEERERGETEKVMNEQLKARSCRKNRCSQQKTEREGKTNPSA